MKKLKMSEQLNLEDKIPIEKYIYEPLEKFRQEAHVKSIEEYNMLYSESMKNSDDFWTKIADEFFWKQKPDINNVLQYNFNFERGPIFIHAFKDGITNICYNVLDRFIEQGLGDKIAYYWEGNDPMDFNRYSYLYLYTEVCKFANLLREKGVKKGDRVALYMPMIIELPIAMLGCARIGAVHLVIFGGFSGESMADRIFDGKCNVLITCDGVWRGTKLICLKHISDQAMDICLQMGHTVQTCLVVKHVTSPGIGISRSGPGCRPVNDLLINMTNSRDQWWSEAMSSGSLLGNSPIEWVDSEHPLFIIHTSGSTGKPKGVVHSTAGYMVYSSTTFKYVFDYHKDDIYWCTADIGWITGHSYVIYGPLSKGATGIIFEGIPTYPDSGRFWQIVDKYLVTKFYTAPTVIRSLMKSGNEIVNRYKLDSLKVLGSVGEPINPRTWLWYYEVIGKKRCPIVDTFWQTETGGHVITPLPGATAMKAGSATLPFFGIEPAIVDEDGKEINGPGEGYLVFKKPWPGIMRTVYNDAARFEDTYFKRFPSYYSTGDGAKRDEMGYYTITGRVDDMMNVSGHLISTAQIESVLVSHQNVVEAAAVPVPHDVKGEYCHCFITLADNFNFDDILRKELGNIVRSRIGAFAVPDIIQEVPALPKTRSGKIMRRLLRKIASGDPNFGDISTLADPNVIEIILKSQEINV